MYINEGYFSTFTLTGSPRSEEGDPRSRPRTCLRGILALVSTLMREKSPNLGPSNGAIPVGIPTKWGILPSLNIRHMKTKKPNFQGAKNCNHSPLLKFNIQRTLTCVSYINSIAMLEETKSATFVNTINP